MNVTQEADSVMGKHPVRWPARTGLLLFGLALGLGLAELLIRIAAPQPLASPMTETVGGLGLLRPDHRARMRVPGSFDVRMTIGSQPFRATSDYALQPGPGDRRRAKPDSAAPSENPKQVAANRTIRFICFLSVDCSCSPSREPARPRPSAPRPGLAVARTPCPSANASTGRCRTGTLPAPASPKAAPAPGRPARACAAVLARQQRTGS